MAKKFFFVCAGLMCLVVAYHLGAQGASAQAGSMVSGFVAKTPPEGGYRTDFWVMTPSGDIYYSGVLDGRPATFVGNFWGGATPSTQSTWGGIKVKAR